MQALLGPVSNMNNATEIATLNRKRRTHQPLTDDERAILREYYSKYNKRKKGIHIRESKAQVWEAHAVAAGVSFSQWVQHAVDSYLRGGDQDEVRELRNENQKLQDELASTRRSMARFAEENGAMQSRLESLERSLSNAVDTLHSRGA